jgi:hypothetical protein
MNYLVSFAPDAQCHRLKTENGYVKRFDNVDVLIHEQAFNVSDFQYIIPNKEISLYHNGTEYTFPDAIAARNWTDYKGLGACEIDFETADEERAFWSA